MTVRTRIGIVGLGKVAHNHAQAVQSLPQTELAGVCSRSIDKSTDFASQYGTRGYSDVRNMVQTEHIEIVIICTPHPAHLAVTIPALEAGAHVLVEKPLASSLTDCDAMLKAAAQTARQLGVISQRRWYAPVERVKKAIDQGKLGKPILATLTQLGWRDQAYYQSDPWRGKWNSEGGGVLINQAPHLLDLLLWFMGEVDSVSALSENLNHPYIEVEDTAVAIIKFKSGALGSIVASNSQNPGLYSNIHVHGANGASIGVQTDSGSIFIAGMTDITDPPLNDLWTVQGEATSLENMQAQDRAFFKGINPMVYYFAAQIADFIDAVNNQSSPRVSGEDGRRVVALINAIYKSSNIGPFA